MYFFQCFWQIAYAEGITSHGDTKKTINKTTLNIVLQKNKKKLLGFEILNITLKLETIFTKKNDSTMTISLCDRNTF